VLYWPSLGFGPLSLDDAGQLTLAAQQPATQIWMADRYGHVRPLKSALFWLLARHDGDWGAVRAGMLAALIVATVLVQRFAARLTRSAFVGVSVAACWALNPCIAAVTCWLSAASAGMVESRARVAEP